MAVETEVLQLIRKAVAAKGPISFSEYMELALYSDPDGYYRRKVPGRGGDYRTSPTLSPFYGALVAAQLEQMWEGLGAPEDFRVTEVGGGGADLARSALGALSPELLKVVTWCFVEPLASIEAVQRDAMASVARPGQTEWTSDLDDLEPAYGVILANEVLDNMSFDLLEVGDRGFHEIRIAVDGDRLVEAPTLLKEGSDLFQLGKAALEHLEPGDRLEIRRDVGEWVRSAVRTLKRGYLILIDYGDTEPQIWTGRPAGTLVTYRREQLGFDPLKDPGRLDITAYVNFSALSRAAADAGLALAPLLTQREWLRLLGLGDIVERLKQEQRVAQEGGDTGRALGLLSERSRAASLAYRGGLGDLRVFIGAKEAPVPRLLQAQAPK